jgi:hypothetical protein
MNFLLLKISTFFLSVFLFFNVVTLFILIHVSIQLSDYKSKKRLLAQEIALLRDKVEELSRKMSSHESSNL